MVEVTAVLYILMMLLKTVSKILKEIVLLTRFNFSRFSDYYFTWYSNIRYFKDWKIRIKYIKFQKVQRRPLMLWQTTFPEYSRE